ncbi:protein of unknown function [Zhouia amylolytica]|uniref:DUF4270 domain-containing protein n=1 Tax=Zhouia amylolytica TaxID=376730 RepID=A0A1I6SGY2_9FLAO|nr:DUF4270 domain-containing protein [Zhouia amylolytica]MCQ0111661.1 DUF4270 domain-containing protein [Zhouia amylolytica]SFS76008.1 protein of unknown function [Zhouia amylolytica]
MRFQSNKLLNTLLVLGSVVFFIACDEEFNTIGSDIFDENDRVADATYEVSAVNNKMDRIRTDNLPVFQLGDYKDPVYGKTNYEFITQVSLSSTVFGKYSQELEDNSDADDSDATIVENETVSSVYLYIPFFSEEVEDTTSTEVDENDPKEFTLDSIYGNMDQEFNLKVQESTYYLRRLDPDQEFTEAQEYYSDGDLKSFNTTVIYDDVYKIDPSEILFFENEDDPDTEDEDESQNVSSRLTPGLYVQLDNAFFQEKILDMEGNSVLANSDNLKDYLRGFYFSIDSPTDDLLMLLDIENANIRINYDYDEWDNNDTTDDTSDDQIVTSSGNITLSLSSNGNDVHVNFIEESAYPAVITEQLNSAEDASRIYLRGGAGAYAALDLFVGEDLEALRAENRLVNQADLLLYIDTEAMNSYGDPIYPDRLFLYKLEEGESIVDQVADVQLDAGGAIYSGVLELDENDNPWRYRFGVTEHVTEILRGDSENVTLGLSFTADVTNFNYVAATSEGNDIMAPKTAAISPLGVILYGNNISQDNNDKKLRLELYYTKTK